MNRIDSDTMSLILERLDKIESKVQTITYRGFESSIFDHTVLFPFVVYQFKDYEWTKGFRDKIEHGYRPKHSLFDSILEPLDGDLAKLWDDNIEYLYSEKTN